MDALLTISFPEGPAWGLFVVVTIVLFAPLLAERIGLPGIIGLIIGGILINPESLALIEHPESLFALGEVGILYLMFMAGLELDLNVFNQVRNRAIAFGLTTFALPFTLGMASALILDYDTAAAVLIGSLWASHTLVTYPIVRRFGLTSNPAVAMAVGATVITDTMALLVLAIVVGTETGDETGVQLALELGVGLAILMAACFLLMPLGMRAFFRGAGQERTLRYVALLVCMTGAAVLADEMGIEGIVGAFFAGLALNRLVPNGSPLMERAEFFGTVFFIPAFLVSVGLRVDPSVLASAETLGLAAVFLGAVVGGKLGAAFLTGRRLGFSGGEIGTVFGLTVSQAAATLAAAIVGQDAGILDEQVVNATIVVVVVSLFIASVTTERFGSRVQPETEGEEGRLGSVVLVPLAAAKGADQLLRFARRIAEADSGLVIPFRAHVSGSGAPDEPERQLVRELQKAVGESGLETQLTVRVDYSLPAAIRNAAVERDGTLLVLEQGPRADTLDVVFGRKADELIATTPVPTVVVSLADVERKRVVVVTGPVAGGVLSVNGRLALRLARSLEAGGLAILVGTPSPDAVEREFPDLKDKIEEVRGNYNAWALRQAEAGDIFIFPASRSAIVFGGGPSRLSGIPGVSVGVVAGPYGAGVFGRDLQLGLGARGGPST
jgi:Kef-type K+ transport system membrane component KefB